tara:strand:- start:10 stop:459 length:450 start_codon:yes stop_codon:yes gene_type:complete
MELNMKKISIVLISLLSSLIMGQKEIPGSESASGTLLDERTNGSQDLVIDPEVIQEVRMIKVNKEKAFMKKQILKGVKYEPKTFKVNNGNSKLLAIKKIIEEIKHKSVESNISSQEIMIIKSGRLDKDLEMNDEINIKMNTKKINHGNK